MFEHNKKKFHINWVTRCLCNQDAVVLFRLKNLGAFLFEFTLGAILIESAVVFASIRNYEN